MTSQPMDFRDYLIRKQQQAWQQPDRQAIPKSTKIATAEIARRIGEQAYDTAEGAAAAAKEAEEALGGDHRSQGPSQEDHERRGLTEDARHALAELRQRHKEIAAHVPSIKIAYDGAVKTIEDPAARVAELTSRFGSLRRGADHAR